MKLNKKGFTLAELLIVVAIIAVLIAIAIPVFGSQLENSRDAQSVANIRSSYAQAMVANMQKASTGDVTYYSSGTSAGKVLVKNVKLQTSDTKLGDSANDLPLKKDNSGKLDSSAVTFAETNGKGMYNLLFTFSSSGDTVTITAAS